MDAAAEPPRIARSGVAAETAASVAAAGCTDWPHPSITAAVMPDDGQLLDLFYDWTPDE